MKKTTGLTLTDFLCLMRKVVAKKQNERTVQPAIKDIPCGQE
jgi:hypothetical protein